MTQPLHSTPNSTYDLLSSLAANELSDFLGRLTSTFKFYRERLGSRSNVRADAAQVLREAEPMDCHSYAQLRREVMEQIGQKVMLADLSTGTTGAPKLRLGTERDEEAEAEVCRRFFNHIGITANDRILALDIDSADIYLFYGKAMTALGIRDFVYSTVQSDCYIPSFSTLKPTTLITVPTVLERALYRRPVAALRNAMPGLRKIIYIGEPMSPSLRRRLATALDVECFSFYGSTEIGSIAGECRDHSGEHLFSDLVVPSILQPTFRAGSVSGEVLWTTMHFSDHPVVKYRTGDRVTITNEQCPCGIRGIKLRSISRIDDDFLLYGHTFSYESFANAIEDSDRGAVLEQVRITRPGTAFALEFVVGGNVAVDQETLEEAIRSADELAYFEELGFVKFSVVQPDSSLNGRKTRKVLFST